MGVQLGVRLTRSTPLLLKKLIQIERRVSFPHVIDGPRQFMGQYRQGFALTMFFREASEVLLARRIVAQEQDGGFGESPLEVGIADLRARSSIAFASRFFRTLDEATIGHELLDTGEAVDIVDLIEQHQGQDLADPWDGSAGGRRSAHHALLWS
jgi:hypothetical protein